MARKNEVVAPETTKYSAWFTYEHPDLVCLGAGLYAHVLTLEQADDLIKQLKEAAGEVRRRRPRPVRSRPRGGT